MTKSEAVILAIERLLERSHEKYQTCVKDHKLKEAIEWRGVMVACEELLDFASDIPDDLGQVNTPVNGS
jgi:hypothetical protein